MSKVSHKGDRWYSTDEIIEALHKVQGGIYLAADGLGCSARTIERRAKQVRKVRDVIRFYRQNRSDWAELKLGIAIENGEPWAIKFQLRTQGKERGYVERVETEQIGETVIKMTWEHEDDNGVSAATTPGASSGSEE